MLGYGQVFIWLDSRITLQYALREGQSASCTFVFLLLAYVATASVDSVDALPMYYYGKSIDTWCCDTRSI